MQYILFNFGFTPRDSNFLWRGTPFLESPPLMRSRQPRFLDATLAKSAWVFSSATGLAGSTLAAIDSSTPTGTRLLNVQFMLSTVPTLLSSAQLYSILSTLLNFAHSSHFAHFTRFCPLHSFTYSSQFSPCYATLPALFNFADYSISTPVPTVEECYSRRPFERLLVRSSVCRSRNVRLCTAIKRLNL